MIEDARGVRRLLVLLMALASSATVLWGLGRPAFWLDESASVVATQRSWPNLFLLLRGPDAPLVPYYTLLKTITTLVTDVDSGAKAHLELLFRWPSALAMVLAGCVLVSWLSRFCPVPLVISSAGMLLLTSGVSRYGQEVRPYALVLLAAVICTASWTRMVQQPGARRLVLYAVSVAVMVVLHDLSAALIGAHLVAAVITAERGRRGPALLRTLAGAGLGLLIAAPLAVTAALNGTGASRYPTLTVAHLSDTFIRLFSPDGRPLLRVGPILLLAAVGLVQTGFERYRFASRLAAAWALVPPAVLLPAVMLRPNLLIGRYLLFTIPGWAILAGLGVVTVAELARGFLARVPVVPAGAAVLTGGALAGLLLAGTALAQAPDLVNVRTPAGHGEDIRPALADANRGADARLPILVSSQIGAIEVPAYDRADDDRLIGIQAQHTLKMIWPSMVSYPVRRQILAGDSRIVLFLRDTTVSQCPETARITPAPEITRCMPAVLRRLKYRVVALGPGGSGWSFSVLARSAR